MPNFDLEYLELLKNQVAEEIAFLVSNGHDNTVIMTPCPFCYGSRDGNYRCNRVVELRQFQSSIAVARTKELQRNRQPIGGITREQVTYEALELFDKSLPPLLQPL